jgi:hypothetical protein
VFADCVFGDQAEWVDEMAVAERAAIFCDPKMRPNEMRANLAI